jgi:predicted secreted Zn-dependent protease
LIRTQERIFVTTDHLTDWRKSSFCGTGACVEVAKTGDEFLVRDSKDANSPILKFTGEEWAAFVAGINAGEFSA